MGAEPDVSGYNHSDSITIHCPPEDVYAIVSDVTRIGELSPVCQAGSWDDLAQAGKEGAWFTPDGEGTDTRGCANVLTDDRSAPCGATTYNTNQVDVAPLRKDAASA